MRVTGIMVYYYFICKRKLWYFSNEISMEQNSELVKLGKIIDENTYSRENKSILIDNTINIDFIKNNAILHEIKKTKAIEEASIWQIKYYMYYLKQRGVNNISGEIDYPLIRERKFIKLTNDDEEMLQQIQGDIISLIGSNKPPYCIKNKICPKCSYYDLCYI